MEVKIQNLLRIYRLLQCGVQIYIKSEERYIEDNERKIMLYLLRNMLGCIDKYNRERTKKGIDLAKENGRYLGRKPIKLDEQLLEQVAIEFINNRLSEQEAMTKLNINSRATFYRKMKIFRENH